MRHEVVQLATKERAKRRAFKEISARRSAGEKQSSGHGTSTRREIVLEDTPEPVVKQEPKTEVVLDDTPEPVVKKETTNQPTSRQMVLKISAANKSDWEFASETAAKSGAVSAEIILSFRY